MGRVNPEMLRTQAIQGAYIVRGGQLMPLEHMRTFSWRVDNRIFLHEIEACGMFAAIIPPGEDIGESVLNDIVTAADQVNIKIGLPKVEHLFFRSREVAQGIAKSSARIAGTNPALQILNVTQAKPQYIQLKTEFSPSKKFNSIGAWVSQIPPSYILAHEENPDLQRKSIHGRLFRNPSDNTYEISLGTDALHARMIGFNGSKYVTMFGHDPYSLIESVLLGRLDGVIDRSSDPQSVFNIVNRFEGHLDSLLHYLNLIRA